MNDHKKKKIAPVVITVLIVVYYAVYFLALILVVPGVAKLLLGVIPILLGAGMIYVCKQRIDEIDGGEEDDLGKY